MLLTRLVYMEHSVAHLKYADSMQKYEKDTGGRLNKKDGLTRYGNSHVKDKTS